MERRKHLADMINDLSLLDVELGGNKFTWSNRRIDIDCIQVRLDRALSTFDWLNHSHYHLSSLIHVGLDHSLISLILNPLYKKKAFPFRFEKMWAAHPNLIDKIKEWWNIDVGGTAM